MLVCGLCIWVAASCLFIQKYVFTKFHYNFVRKLNIPHHTKPGEYSSIIEKKPKENCPTFDSDITYLFAFRSVVANNSNSKTKVFLVRCVEAFPEWLNSFWHVSCRPYSVGYKTQARKIHF